MAQTCTICRSPKRQEIDTALLANTPFRHIASQYGTSTTALQRHKKNDLPRVMVQSRQAAEEVHGADLLSEMIDLNARTLANLSKAERRGDLKIALSAIAEVRRNKELLARLSGELEHKQAQITANFNSQMMSIRTEAEPLEILHFMVTQGRWPTTEERRQLLAGHDYDVTAEPSEKA